MPNAAPSILPPRLDALLASLTEVERHQLVVRGWSRECEDDAHDFALWVKGRYSPPVPEHLARAFIGTRPAPLVLALHMCRNCETVEVRDRTVDRLADGDRLVAHGRRDGLLGWYSGARRANRVYL